MTQTPSKSGSAADQKAWVLGPFIDAAEQDDGELASLIHHVGITIEDLADAGGDVEKAVLEHYRCKGGYDVDRVASDLARYPPIARRIIELKHERKVKRGRKGARSKAT